MKEQESTPANINPEQPEFKPEIDAPVDPKTGVSANTKAKSTNIIKVFIVAILVAGLVLGLVFVLIQLIERGMPGSPYEHDAYFIPEKTASNTKYALVKEGGEVLTEFNIEKYSSFIDGFALVKTSEGWGVINDKGEMTIKPDKYDGMSRVGGLISALEPGSAERKLLHGSGRVVTTFESSKNNKIGSKIDGGALAVAINRGDNQYDIYNAHGDHVAKIESEKQPAISYYSPTGNNEDSITAVSYSSGIFAFKNKDYSTIFQHKDSKKLYTLSGSSYDGSQLLFTRTEKDKQKKTTGTYTYTPTKYYYAAYTAKGFKEYDDRCQSLRMNSDETRPTGYITCYVKNEGEYFVDDRGELRKISDTKERYIIIDTNHYAKYSITDKSLTIGSVTVQGAYSANAANANYVIRNGYTSGSNSVFYDKEGNVICRTMNNVSGGFDMNNVAIARDSSLGQYYLIDNNCKSISKNYSNISKLGSKYYTATMRTMKDGKSEYTYSLLDTSGKEKLNDKGYTYFTNASYRGPLKNMIMARGTENNKNQYDLYDADLNKITECVSATYDSSQDMARIKTDKLYKFYTKEGKEIYSTPIGAGADSRT